MKNIVVYIPGLFEDENNNDFYSALKLNLEGNCYDCVNVPLYKNNIFGAYSFIEEISKINNEIDLLNPKLVIAHSLGGYVATQIHTNCPIILLDPSLSISEIINFNLEIENGKKFYNDGEKRLELSADFISSLSLTPAIEESAERIKNKDICIVGAGLGGHKVAERYKKNLSKSEYIILSNANHNFSNHKDIDDVLSIIKRRLGFIRDRR